MNRRRSQVRWTQQTRVVAAWCVAKGAPPPVVVGGVGADDDPCDELVGVVVKRAGTEGKAKLEGGILSTHGGSGEGATNPCAVGSISHRTRMVTA